MSPEVMISLVGIIAAVVFIIIFTYKGYSPLLLAPIGGAIICLTSGIGLKEGILDLFATSNGNMYKNMMFIYCFGCMFAEVMTQSEAAYSIAEWMAKLLGVKHAAFTAMLIAGVLMIGGMSVGTYMIVFPIAMVLFSKANISKNLMVGCIIAGSWTFGNCAPFSPSNHNNVAMSVLGTGPDAGLIVGLVGTLFLILAESMKVFL